MNINEIRLSFDKKQKVMIISVIAFLCTLIATTYAWVSHDFFGQSETVALTSASMSFTFQGTSPQILADLAPGESAVKTFSITNYSDVSSHFNFNWVDVMNTFESNNYLYYTITNTDTGEIIVSPRYLPKYEINIAYNIDVPAQATQNYTLEIKYINNIVEDQSENINHYFEGNISINIRDYSLSNILNVFIDGELGGYQHLDSYAGYFIDTYRTYCTDGASISLVDGEFEITNRTDTTTCEVYLITNGQTVDTTNLPNYNLLVTNVTDEEIDINYQNYYYEDETISLDRPLTKAGYALQSWSVTGSGSSINNNVLTMGNNYTYLKANWVLGYYNKTIQTCTTGAAASFTRTNKTCVQGSAISFQKTSKVCNSASYYNCTTTTCGCRVTQYVSGTPAYTCSWGWGSTSTAISWSYASSGGCCNGGLGYIQCASAKVSCSGAGTAYAFGAPTTSTVTSCQQNIFTCGSGYVGSTYVSCDPTYEYHLGTTTTTDVQTSCSLSSFSCTKAHYDAQTLYTIDCTELTFEYGFVPSTTQAGTMCITESSFTCNSSSAGDSYISSCDLVITQ